MSLKKIDGTALFCWVDRLIGKTKVIGVQAKDDHFAFCPLSRASDLRLDYDVALTPPNKVCLQPPRETLLKFQGVAYESVMDAEPFVLFGVHPYDMAAINQMDQVFAEGNCDAHYFARRSAATIVACNVQRASENVFAGCMGTAVVDTGFDVLLTKIDQEYVVDARTEKGETLMAALADAPDGGEADLAARDRVWEQSESLLRKHELACPPSQLPELLGRSYEHPVWEERARLCFSCGSCNTTCPTCYCFDVQEDAGWDLKSGERVRVWDGCMLAKFATVAGGHNFRPEPSERFRHRYYRKGKYIPEKFGVRALHHGVRGQNRQSCGGLQSPVGG